MEVLVASGGDAGRLSTRRLQVFVEMIVCDGGWERSVVNGG